MTRSRTRTGCLLLLLLLAALAVVAGVAWQRYAGFADAPIAGIGEDTRLVVRSGDSLPVVLRRLEGEGAEVGQPVAWSALARQMDVAGRIQVGEYEIDPGTTPRELLRMMGEGRVVQHRFTLVEGWNFRQLREAIARAEPLEDEIEGMSDAEIMAALGHAGQHPEGRFLPETYVYTRGDSELDVLRRAHTAMGKALDAAWRARHDDSVLKTPDEMLVLASIVEKETGAAEERPRIAGLFERRLRIGMRLQTDPTVIYGMGAAYDGNIRKRDLTTDTPYNTYTRAGLPPTPIAMPGVGALQAVANPASGTALYFVAIGDGSGRHLFADTLAEHNRNVQRYLANYRAARAAER